MQIHHLITVLGLCLSQTLAMMIPNDAAIKSFVLLVTDPRDLLAGSPAMARLSDSFHQVWHSPDHAEVHRGLFDTVTPLLKGHEDNAKYLAESYVGYKDTAASPALLTHPDEMKKRLEAYRNSLYSQFKDLASNSKEFTAERLEKARLHIFKSLTTSQAPHDLFDQVQKELLETIPTSSKVDLKYLPREEINDQLISTKRAGIPEPILINGKYVDAMLTSHTAHHDQSHFAFPAANPAIAVN